MPNYKGRVHGRQPCAGGLQDAHYGGGAMLVDLLGDSLYGVLAVAAVILVLGLVALIRCDRKDIPAIVRALAFWWRR